MRTPATDSWDETPTVRRRIASMAYESLLLVGVLSISFFLPHLALGMTIEIALPGWVLWAHVFIRAWCLLCLVLAPWRANPGNADLENPAFDAQTAQSPQ
jgi:hypothetical protein